jgi:denticleless
MRTSKLHFAFFYGTALCLLDTCEEKDGYEIKLKHQIILYPLHQVRVWTTKKMDCTNISSPTVIRKRVTAPNTEYQRFISSECSSTSEDAATCSSANAESLNGSHSLQPRVLNFGTPESAKKRVFALFQEEAVDGAKKSPEAQMTSPSSVLSPPPSLKRRTIRDYFGSSTS